MKGNTMQLKAIYNQGRLEFRQPVQFHHDHFAVIVEVEEQEIKITEANEPSAHTYDLPPEVIEAAEQSRKHLDDIMNEPLAPEDELPLLSTKTLERIKAFELREDR
jgi:hypothetical protein